MRKIFVRSLLFAFCLVLVWTIGPTPSAQANELVFGCSSTSGIPISCGGGTVTVSGSNYSSTSGGGNVLTTLAQTSGPGSTATDMFNFSFNTVGNTAKITDLTTTLTLLGTIVGDSVFSGGSTTSLTLAILWTSMPAAMSGFLGTPTGNDLTNVTFDISGGTVVGASINIDPTPEPATLAMLGSGLALMGVFLLRRKSQEPL
jgi:hypothetical protein